MRRSGLWHPRLALIIASMGHTDSIVLADAGLPAPPHVETVDLLWARGEPRLAPVLRAVLDELVVEQAAVAEELVDNAFSTKLHAVLGSLPVIRVSHQALKERCHTARAVVRTGEDTPYANVVLQAGVSF